MSKVTSDISMSLDGFIPDPELPPRLKSLLESLGDGVVATNEPARA